MLNIYLSQEKMTKLKPERKIMLERTLRTSSFTKTHANLDLGPSHTIYSEKEKKTISFVRLVSEY